MAGPLQTDSTVLLYEDEFVDGVFTGMIMDVQQMEGCSFYIEWDGPAFEGIASIECSNDLKYKDNKTFLTLNRSKVDLETCGRHMYDISQFHFRYMRLRIEAVTGSATFNVYYNSRSRKA